MLSFRRFNDELTLIDLQLASLEIQNFHGQKKRYVYKLVFSGGTSLCLLQP